MKINFIKLNFKVVFFLIIFFVIVLSGAIYVVAVGVYSEGHRVNTGAGAQQIRINSSGTCKTITNTSGKDIFIPTKTTTEWNSFAANLPAGVSLADNCCTTTYQPCPPGYIYSYQQPVCCFNGYWGCYPCGGGVFIVMVQHLFVGLAGDGVVALE